MSKCIGGQAIKKFEDNHTLIYSYGAYNLNIPQYKKAVIDGMITIKKEHLQKEFAEQLEENYITVDLCSNCWKKFHDRFDEISLKLVVKLFLEFKEKGIFQDEVNVDY